MEDVEGEANMFLKGVKGAAAQSDVEDFDAAASYPMGQIASADNSAVSVEPIKVKQMAKSPPDSAGDDQTMELGDAQLSGNVITKSSKVAREARDKRQAPRSLAPG